jgi:hypothetical protein
MLAAILLDIQCSDQIPTVLYEKSVLIFQVILTLLDEPLRTLDIGFDARRPFIGGQHHPLIREK